jgi:hypothetical protein
MVVCLSEPSACAGTRKGGSRNVRRRSGPRQRDHFDPPSLSAEREPSRAICGEDESGGANAWAAASRGSQAIRMACVYAPCKRRTTAGQRIAPSRRCPLTFQKLTLGAQTTLSGRARGTPCPWWGEGREPGGRTAAARINISVTVCFGGAFQRATDGRAQQRGQHEARSLRGGKRPHLCGT